jgi:hypothetical protein
MGNFFENIEEALQLTERVLADTEPNEKVDAIFIFSQTPDNESSVLETGFELIVNDAVSFIAFFSVGGDGRGGLYHSDYHQKLISLGVPDEKIILIDLSSVWAHTHTEAIAFVKKAKEKGWKRVYVTASPFHQIRVFAETVTAILNFYPELLAYNKVGKALPWTEHVVHSQNVVTGRRCELVIPETKRLNEYHAKGDLVTARQVLNYLDKRD